MSRSGRCGFEGEPPCEIEEVTIKVPTKATHTLSPGTPYGFDPNYPMPPSGGCGTYNNCGGGGGSPPPPPPPPANPCDKAKLISNNSTNKSLFNTLKEQTTSSGAENAYVIYANGSNDYQPGIANGIGTGELNLSFNGSVDAVLHSHYAGLLSTFSVSDILAVASMYKQGVINNPNTFVFGVVTASGTQYLMVIDDIQKFGNFTNSSINPDGTFNDIFMKLYENIYSSLGISTSSTIENNETQFTKLLDQINTGMKMMKGSSDFSNWSTLDINSSNVVTSQNCNN